jgi:CRP-like cAMP-binding protein
MSPEPPEPVPASPQAIPAAAKPAAEVMEFLRTKVPFINGLVDEEQAMALAAAVKQISFDREQAIPFEGETEDGLHVVAAGRVCVWVKPDPSNPALAVAQWGPGQVFGKNSITAMSTAEATVKGDEDATLIFVIPQTAIRAVLRPAQSTDLRARAQALVEARKKAAKSAMLESVVMETAPEAGTAPAAPQEAAAPAAASPEVPQAAAAGQETTKPAIVVTEFLKTKVPFLNGLIDDEQATVLATAVKQVPFGREQPVLFEGETEDGLHVVASGQVSVWVKPDPSSSALTAVQLGPGEVFGKNSIMAMSETGATVKADADDTTIFVIPQAAFRAILGQNAELRTRAQDLTAARKKAAASAISAAGAGAGPEAPQAVAESPRPPEPVAASPEILGDAALGLGEEASKPAPAPSKLRWILPLALILAGGGGFLAYNQNLLPFLGTKPPQKNAGAPKAKKNAAHHNAHAAAPAPKPAVAKKEPLPEVSAPVVAKPHPIKIKAIRRKRPAVSPAAAVAPKPAEAPPIVKKQDIFDTRRQLDLQVQCLRSRCARPGIATLARNVKTLAGACMEATTELQRLVSRLQDDGLELGKTDQNLKLALVSLQEQITQGSGTMPDMDETFRQAQLNLTQAGVCLDQLGEEADLPQNGTAAAACTEKARAGLWSVNSTLSAIQSMRRDGRILIEKLIQSAQSEIINAPPDNARQYSSVFALLAEASASYEHGLATVINSLSIAESAMSQTQVSNIDNLRRSAAYHLKQMPAIRVRVHAVALPEFPESGEAIRDIDAATSRLEQAENEWTKASASSNKDALGIETAMASRDTLAALDYLARARDLMLALMARVPGSEPPPLSPQNPAACDSLY